MTLILAAVLLAGSNNVASPVEAAAKPVKEKKICKVDPGFTGSRMKPKLCLTEAEWAQRNSGKDAGDLKNLGAR